MGVSVHPIPEGDMVTSSAEVAHGNFDLPDFRRAGLESVEAPASRTPPLFLEDGWAIDSRVVGKDAVFGRWNGAVGTR